MAAGGFKEFVAGEVLDQDEINDYLMQGMLVFAGTAARGSAITTPVEGQFSFLKDSDSVEFYDGSAWQEFSTSPGSVVATGGTFGTATIMGVEYGVHTFNGNGTLTVSAGGDVEYVMVAGGGGGGGGLSASSARGATGQNTTFASVGTAFGGGGGAAYAVGPGLPGGSGGGGAATAGGLATVVNPGAGTAGQGFAGGFGTDAIQRVGGGGGGAIEKGQFGRLEGSTYFAGDGGDGLRTLVSGSYAYLAGGGAGVTRDSITNGTAIGGLGGGGSAKNGVAGVSGTTNTGGGGGAASNDSLGQGGGGAGGLLSGFTTLAAGSYSITIGSGGAGGSGGGNVGGSGGSGVVIVRYPL